jgi:hypothetical protein
MGSFAMKGQVRAIRFSSPCMCEVQTAIDLAPPIRRSAQVRRPRRVPRLHAVFEARNGVNQSR